MLYNQCHALTKYRLHNFSADSQRIESSFSVAELLHYRKRLAVLKRDMQTLGMRLVGSWGEGVTGHPTMTTQAGPG